MSARRSSTATATLHRPTALRTTPPHAGASRQTHSSASDADAVGNSRMRGRLGLVLLGVAVEETVRLTLFGDHISNESAIEHYQLHEGHRTRGLFLWGSNKHNVTAPHQPDVEVIKQPKPFVLLDGVALRELVLHEKYAVAIDEHGDLLQWGDGFDNTVRETGDIKPRKTLQGKNIIQVAATSEKIYALSKKGEVWLIAANAAHQAMGQQNKSYSYWSYIAWLWGSRPPGVDTEKLTTNVALASGENIVTVSSGSDHVLALTTAGRAFAVPASSRGNSNGQLGVRAVQLFTTTRKTDQPGDMPPPQQIQMIPDGFDVEFDKSYDRLLGDSIGKLANYNAEAIKTSDKSDSAQADIRFCTVLHELPSLRGVAIDQLVAGARHSVAKTKEGRILTWGANSYGQLGLGPQMAFPTIPTPTELPLTKSFPASVAVKCDKVAAGGDTTYLVVTRNEIRTGNVSIEVLACGNGRFGQIGNAAWAHQGSPTKVKTISGLLEWSDHHQSIAPIAVHDLSVSSTHCAITLDNAVVQHDAKFGRDVFVWGHNESYQLGTGKRSNLAVPQHLPPLPYPNPAKISNAPESALSSGTPSPMAHHRLQLATATKVEGRKMVEEAIVAGHGSTAVYWRIV
ncbi:hypothetical protein E5Q_00787 [Mixia osmundae IAM 14324]|uniref:Uncharacterized protein n=1 Tax=Mixia osmundae (strain CBS 9802 / IAM 14324 / JCM 22182 / KY 12970) TaxID=764103 RepID=G7DU79_MIXOS|nr:hypothetical protein E5Q_00787 [Mixia osmundae IAM 14324]